MAKKKYIQVPRGYLSQSQVVLWLNNPTQYKKIYFDDRTELRPSNKAMTYGKEVADALEKGVQTGDLLTDAAMLMLPKYDTPDQEFRVDMKTKHGWVTLLAKPDTLDSKTKAFGEYKTARRMWTNKRAQEHFQMHFYAAAIYLKWKVVPKAKLVCIETAMDDEAVVPTGRVEEFPVVITMKDILKTMALVGKVAREIEVAWAAHVTDPRIANF